MADRISKLQFWEALEYSGHGVSWGEVQEMYETYKSKKLMIDIGVAKEIERKTKEITKNTINQVKANPKISASFRSLL